ncbi:hypothetical protein T01_8903 [Trichinella spiralis]|uniref:Uncharacterized protein n=1 Tax=Trichinella spiralis TaxID=6334 RepID=A0A0V1BFL2_TRISP|nr:hypothetical protein T01_8903 [Trichinella spiralis]
MIHYNLEQHTEKVDINDRKTLQLQLITCSDEAKQNEQIYDIATRRRIYKQRKFRLSSLKIAMVASRVTLEPVEQQQLTLHTFLLFLQYHKNCYN